MQHIVYLDIIYFIPVIFRSENTRNKMSKNLFTISNRAMEMFQSGQGADCVIEVVPQIDGQEKQVFFCCIGALFSVIPPSVSTLKITIKKHVATKNSSKKLNASLKKTRIEKRCLKLSSSIRVRRSTELLDLTGCMWTIIILVTNIPQSPKMWLIRPEDLGRICKKCYKNFLEIQCPQICADGYDLYCLTFQFCPNLFYIWILLFFTMFMRN
jgi:hypothetical protein